MKRTVKYGMAALLVAVVTTMVGCSTDGDDDAYIAFNDPNADALVYGKGIYEGEWSVNRQVVDTARMVVKESGEIQVRLPERYLLSLCFTDNTDITVITSNLASLIEVHEQGYSETSQYMSIGSEKAQTNEAESFFVNCSFIATIDRTPYLIQLLSKEFATAVMQNTSGQWTLSIPIDSFILTNALLSAYKPEVVELPQTITIYYNTKRRVE